MPCAGAEHPAQIPRETPISETGGAECGAPDAPDARNRPDDSDLCRIIDAWPDLPMAIRRAILAVIETSASGEE